MVQTKTYENGLRIVVENIDYLRSVSMGILVGVGSCFETVQENGISHFIEHVNFKGTKKRSAFEISDEIDRIGAQINAFTSKDITCYYVKCIDEHIDQSFEILSDLFNNSVYPEDELDKERGVVIEEINMADDTPDDLCLDLLAESYFGKNGYGATILGPRENINNFKRTDILAYKRKYYLPSNTVISFAGKITFEKACEIVERNFNVKGQVDCVLFPQYNTKCLCRHLAVDKAIEQNHIAIGIPGVCITSPDRAALICINSILGGGMSSRLFQSVREKYGLAYSVYSYLSTYKETGVFYIYAGVNPTKVGQAYDCIISEIKKVGANGITKDELTRAKEQIKGSTVLSSESTSSLMLSQGKRVLLTNEVFNIDQELEHLSLLTLDYVNEKARDYLNVNVLATAIVGKNVKAI